MIIEIVNRQRKQPIAPWRPLLRRLLPDALERATAGHLRSAADEFFEPHVTIHFVGPRTMRQINRTTRGVDQSTDVLSFPALDMREGKLCQKLTPALERLPDGRRLLPIGDILLAPERALEQARQYGHSLEREILFLALHGLLHLLGFDHDKPASERRMRQLQTMLLASAGLSRTADNPPVKTGANAQLADVTAITDEREDTR